MDVQKYVVIIVLFHHAISVTAAAVFVFVVDFAVVVVFVVVDVVVVAVSFIIITVIITVFTVFTTVVNVVHLFIAAAVAVIPITGNRTYRFPPKIVYLLLPVKAAQ